MKTDSEAKPVFTFIDLFSGIGGFHYALSKLGGKCVMASDISRCANQTYAQNYGLTPLGDICSISSNDIPDFDILCAGFPCQSFSNVGTRRGLQDPRGKLVFEVFRILKDKKPSAFILENVKGLLSHDQGKTFSFIVNNLEKCGYFTYTQVMEAKDYNLPQLRKRLFFVGIRKDLKIKYIFPEPVPLTTTLSQVLGGKVDRDCAFTIRIGGRHSGINNRFNWDSYRVDGRVRTITISECLQLQGFPPDFALSGNEAEQFMQVGNTVPTNVVEAIGRQLLSTGIFTNRRIIMDDVRTLCEKWSGKTYSEALTELTDLPSNVAKKASELFAKIEILNVPMNGYSCEKLPKTEENRGGISKTYSEIFHTEAEKAFFSPASYLAQIVSEGMAAQMDDTAIAGILARGLRTFASLLKEPDFAIQLKEGLKQYDADVTTNLNSKQDSTDHTDVLLVYKKMTYRIWLYQFSARGLPHDVERLTGKRGELPDGRHIICPLHTEKAIKYDTLCKKCEKLEEKLKAKETELSNCSVRAWKRKQGLETIVIKINGELKEAKMSKLLAKREADPELDIVNGWFFYSKSHIQNIISCINNSTHPMKYQDVVRILNGPEELVGQTNVFDK